MDYHLENCGIDTFKKSEYSQNHTFYPHFEEDEEDEDDDLVEEDIDLIESDYCNGTNEVVNCSIKSVLYVMKEIVFMLLDNVVLSVFVSNVIKTKVILIY